MLRAKTTRQPYRDIPKLASTQHPQCHRCGGATRFLEMLDQPVYGEPGKALTQYACKTCHILIEELRPV
jgi:hypothetical protein